MVERKDVSETARAYFDYYTAEQRAAQQQQVDIGKWILGSLILINGGAITLIAQAPKGGINALASGNYFVVGLVSAVLCGFSAWLNSGVRDIYLDGLAKPEMLTSSSSDDWPKESPQRIMQIRVTFAFSIFFGLLSLAMFGWGAWIVTRAFNS